MQLQFHNDPGVEIISQDDQRFTFSTSGVDAETWIRIVLAVPSKSSEESVDIELDLEIAIQQGVISHVSVVNADVTEGRMVEVPLIAGESGDVTIGGVFRPFSGHALLVIRTQGPTSGVISIKRSAIATFKVPDKIRVLFYIEPWIERNHVFFKENYLSWFHHQAKSLQQARSGYEFLVVGNESLAHSLDFPSMDLPFAGLAQESLLKIFPSAREALTAWCNDLAPPSAVQAMQDLVTAKLGPFSPDIIIAMEPAPYLRTLYPQALLLYSNGLFFRPPFPDGIPMFDPLGALHRTVTEGMAHEITCDPSASIFMQKYRDLIDHDAAELNAFVARKVDSYRTNFEQIVVFALQDLQYFNIFGVHPFGTQIDYLIDAMGKIDPRIGVIVVQHPASRDIEPQSMDWLLSKFPNLIYDRQINELHAPSQALLPYVDGLVTTTSGLIYLAAIRQKPAFLTHPTHFSALAHARPLDSINSAGAFAIDKSQVDTEMAWILRHHAFSHAFMLHSSWLHDRLLRLRERQQQGSLTWRGMPRIASDASILQSLKQTVRPNIDATPPVERPVAAQERQKYEKMYVCSEYHGNDSVIARAKMLVDCFDLDKSAKILDVGCGPGSASYFLKKQGYDVLAIDIASNCLDEDKRGEFPLLISCVWELPEFVQGEVFLCSDVMEHIPPEFVSKTLQTLAQACKLGGLFLITMRPDGCGRLIGETLHLTVQPLDWWLSELGKHWPKTTILQENKQEQYAIFRASHD